MPQDFTSAEMIDQVAARLALHPLFACLDAEARLGIAQRCGVIQLPAGTVLMRQGDPGSFACMVLDGAIDIFVEIAAGPVQIATLGQNQIVGELGLLTDTPRSATAVAQTDTMAIRVEREVLINLVSSYPAIGLSIIRELGRRLSAMNPALAYLTAAANALSRDEYDPAMLGELTNEPGLFAGFARAFAQMAAELRNKQLRHQEMLAAAAIQQSILPAPIGEDLSAVVDLHAETHPAREVGGDFYDYFMPDDEQLAVTIADVAGKGIPAALYMAVARTVMRSVASITDLAARVREANRLLSAENTASMFVTMFHGVLNLKTGALVYCNAGHNPPYLVRAEALEPLNPTGPAFGLDIDMRYGIGEKELGRGDTLFLFTDGFTEAVDGRGEEFGTHRLETALAHSRGLAAHDIVASLLAELRSFVGAAEQGDDITCLALRIPG